MSKTVFMMNLTLLLACRLKFRCLKLTSKTVFTMNLTLSLAWLKVRGVRCVFQHEMLFAQLAYDVMKK